MSLHREDGSYHEEIISSDVTMLNNPKFQLTSNHGHTAHQRKFHLKGS